MNPTNVSRVASCALTAVAGLALSAGAADRTWNRTTVATGTNWENAAYWTGGIPGTNDRAYFPGISPLADNTCRPALTNGAVVTIRGIYMNNQYSTSVGWQIRNADNNFPGTIVLGSLGIENHNRAGGFNIYPNVVLAADQTWQIDPEYNDTAPTLFGTLTGSGKLTRGGNCGNGVTFYQRKDSPTFSGGLVVQRGTVQWNALNLTSADAGTYTFGSAPITLNGGIFLWSCTGSSGGGDSYIMDLTNAIVVTSGGSLKYNQAGGVGYYPCCRFSGPVSLNGILRIWGGGATGTIAPKYEGAVTIDQSNYYCAGISRGDTGSGQNGFDPQTYNANIVDGSGPSRKPLVLQTHDGEFRLTGTGNTYANGTVVSWCGGMTHAAWYTAFVSAGGSSAFGTGHMLLEPGARVRFYNGTQLATGKTATVHRTSCALGTLAAFYDGLPPISPDSEGVIGIETATFTAITDMSTVGNGKMFLGAGRSSGTFTGATLAPGAGNMYRLGCGNRGDATLTVPNAVLTGSASLQVSQAGWWGNSIVRLNGANTFSGSTDVMGIPVCGNGGIYTLGSSLEGNAQTTVGASPFGGTNGAVSIHGSAMRLYGVASAQKAMKGQLSFEGFSRVVVDRNSQTASLQFAGLTRSNRGALEVNPFASSLGTSETLFITNQTDTAFMPPYVVYHSSGGTPGPDFLWYDKTGGTGVRQFTAYNLNLLTSTSSDIVSWSGALGGGTYAAKALKVSMNITGSGTLNLGDGTYAGLILNGNLGDAGTTVNLGNSECVIYNGTGARTISAKISGTGGGITVTGTQDLTINNTANDFTGTITAQGGGKLKMCLDTAAGTGSMGDVNNGIYLNGGILTYVTSGDRILASRTITLGPCGGYLDVAQKTILCKITGPGALFQGYGVGNWTIGGTAGNDYQGGTFLSIGTQTTMYINNGATLGTGPVHMGPGTALRLLGDTCINAAARLYVAATATAYFESAAPVIGSLEDCGNVQLGTAAVASALTLGADNSDFTFYGNLSQTAAGFPGSVTKTGNGTFTLYGNNTYTGPTTVSQGKLMLMGQVASNLVVNSGATLGANGGRIAGSLNLQAGSTLSINLRSGSDSDNLTVGVTATLNGALVVTPVAGYQPVAGSKWTILNTGGTTVNFSGVTSGYLARRIAGNKVELSYPPKGTVLFVL